MIEYVYRKKKLGKRIHIKTDKGTVCKMENAENGRYIRKLDTVSERFPEGRKLCKICDSISNNTPLLPDEVLDRDPWEREALWD